MYSNLSWHPFHPFPNLLWLHVFNDKTIFGKNYRIYFIVQPLHFEFIFMYKRMTFSTHPISHITTHRGKHERLSISFTNRINFILFNYKRLFIDGILTRLGDGGGEHEGSWQKWTMFIHCKIYGTKSTQHPSAAFPKKRTKNYFFCLAFDWNCILFRGVDLESTLCVSCAQTQKKRQTTRVKNNTLLLFCWFSSFC